MICTITSERSDNHKKSNAANNKNVTNNDKVVWTDEMVEKEYLSQETNYYDFLLIITSVYWFHFSLFHLSMLFKQFTLPTRWLFLMVRAGSL